jgi:thiosulfate/3-mercaptopyruvate sulfurtransferase
MNKSIVDCSWLNDHLLDDDLVILDASPKSNVSGLESEYAGIRIKGAVSIDIKGQFSDKHSEMPNTLLSPEEFQKAAQSLGINKRDKIVVYDNLGIYSSPRVWWMFKAMGHEAIAVLDGGLPEWINQGYATEKIEDLDILPGDFVAELNQSMVKYIEDVVSNIESKEYSVLDARSLGRFAGTAPEPRKGLSSGHVPRSQSLPFKDVLDGGKMKSKSELKKIFESKISGDEPIIFSCGSGLTACITLLAADQVLDNEKSVYDGSWTEWAQKQPNLIEKE